MSVNEGCVILAMGMVGDVSLGGRHAFEVTLPAPFGARLAFRDDVSRLRYLDHLRRR
jgi:hypothetical protein